MKKFTMMFIGVLMFTSMAFSVDFKINGVYTAWAQSQNQFWLGKKDANGFKYEDNYVVQMLRFKVAGILNENLKVVTRFDLAQGWWGVDNALRSVQRTGTSGGSALFDYKDTNFLFHVDLAFVEFKIPSTSLTARVGRMWYGLGNKIMVDNNYDGIQLDIDDFIGKKMTLSWAKVNENGDNLSDQHITAPDGTPLDYRDADLYSINLSGTASSDNFTYDAFAFYYTDRSTTDMTAFVPDGLQFFKTRFSPQISELMAFGAAANWTLGKLELSGEFDILTGKDKIENTLHGAKQLVDINNGDLSGYNIYLKGNYAATDKVAVGGVIGMGSGDDNLTQGSGNVNKLRTSGFFYITEVWEDSIMPDEEGITPQGLGAPNVRAYRELENTTAIQLNTTLKPFPKFTAFFSYTYLLATEDIHAWASDGQGDWTIDPNTKANDIGQEFDFRFGYQFYDELGIMLRGGYFMPGDAAGYLINGTNAFDDPAWELKGLVTYKF
jgi:hypothetical protein